MSPMGPISQDQFDSIDTRLRSRDTPNRPEVTISTEGIKRSTLNDKGGYDDHLYTNTKSHTTKPTQSFDSIIMECQDMLSVETEVKKRYEEWLGGGKSKYSLEINQEHKSGVLSLLASVLVLVSSLILGILSLLFEFDGRVPMTFGVISFVSGLAWAGLGDFWKYFSIKDRVKPKQNPSEASKFQFLKDSYSGTIKNLNQRLELVQDKISNQIETHRKDKRQIEECRDLFDDVSDVINKIDSALCELNKSSKNLSEKKVEINKALNDYIGENGYIAEKEREIERIKIAQELSERIKTNFKETLEITKSVDVLADVIIPGIKQLMSLKIPELIDKVNYECDKEKAFLEIAK